MCVCGLDVVRLRTVLTTYTVYALWYTDPAIVRRDSFVRTERRGSWSRSRLQAGVCEGGYLSTLAWPLSLTEATRIFEFFHVFDFPGTPNLSTTLLLFR